MKLSSIYTTTLKLVNNPSLIEAIYKEKEAILSDENKLRVADWLSFFNKHKDEFCNIYSSTIYAIFNAITEKELFLKLGEEKHKISKQFYLQIAETCKKNQVINSHDAMCLLNLCLIYAYAFDAKIKTIEESGVAIEKEINEETVFKFFLNLFVKEFYHSILPKSSINGSMDEIRRLIQDIVSSNGRTTIEKNTRAHTLHLSLIHYISQMDIDMIDAILPDTITYNDVSKKQFIIALDLLFNEFKSYGDTRLIQFRGVCQICKKGYPGFTYIGNHSKNFINIIIELPKRPYGNIDIADIYDCSSFKNNIGVLNLNKQLKINTDIFKSDIYTIL